MELDPHFPAQRSAAPHTQPSLNHPQQEGSLRKLFKSPIALLNKSTHLFPADINLRDLSSSPQCQTEVTSTGFTGHLSSFLITLGLLQAEEE